MADKEFLNMGIASQSVALQAKTKHNVWSLTTEVYDYK